MTLSLLHSVQSVSGCEKLGIEMVLALDKAVISLGSLVVHDNTSAPSNVAKHL